MRGRFRFVIAALLFAAGMINYMDRAALSVVAPKVAKDLALSPHALGEIFSSFFFGYALFCFVGGFLADRFGPRRVYAWAMAVWSLFCGLTATVSGFLSLLFVRVVFGIGEGPMCAVTNKTVCNWFPRHETASMIGVTFAGQPLGTALAGPLVGLAAIALGWRWSFVIIAALGFLWLGAWLLVMRDTPSAHPRVDEAERRYIAESRARHVPLESGREGGMVKALLRPSTFAVAAGLFAANYVIYFFLSWLPSYFVSAQHFSFAAMSLITSLPWLGGALGYAVGGLVSDALLKWTGNGLIARKAVAMGGLGVAAAAVLMVPLVHGQGSAVALVTLAITFLMASPQANWALTQELVEPEKVGAVSGFAHFLSNFSGMIAPAVTGFAIEYGGGYTASFVLTGLVGVVGVLAMLVLVPNSPPASAALPIRPVASGGD
jgi:ACS family hexuronate transporter-like MFS transporter